MGVRCTVWKSYQSGTSVHNLLLLLTVTYMRSFDPNVIDLKNILFGNTDRTDRAGRRPRMHVFSLTWSDSFAEERLRVRDRPRSTSQSYWLGKRKANAL